MGLLKECLYNEAYKIIIVKVILNSKFSCKLPGKKIFLNYIFKLMFP